MHTENLFDNRPLLKVGGKQGTGNTRKTPLIASKLYSLLNLPFHPPVQPQVGN